MKVLFSIGHGKNVEGTYDPGAISYCGYHEHKLIKDLIDAMLTVNKNIDYINYDSNMSLFERIDYINSCNYDLVVELHFNSATTNKATGVECYYNSRIGGTYIRSMANELAKACSEAQGIPNRQKNSNRDSSYFGILRETRTPTLLLETCFINNPTEFANFNSKKYSTALAILKTLGISQENDEFEDYYFDLSDILGLAEEIKVNTTELKKRLEELEKSKK